MSESPQVIVLAGPNGAGKSTVAPRVLQSTLGVTEFVNADVIAQGLSAFAPERAAISAGRIMLARLYDLAEQRMSFAFETTLASRSFAPWIEGLVKDGYEFRLFYIWLPSPDVAISRVAERVKAGGHHVPDDVIRRRYGGGIRNFFGLYREHALEWRVMVNSGTGPELIAVGRYNEVTRIADPELWAMILAEGNRHVE
jgi:predicted ABC-type ATPase